MFFRLFMVTVFLLLQGCTGIIYPNDRGKDGGSRHNTFLVDSISFSGTTSEDSSVTIGDVPDEDGMEDTSWQAEFFLDDGSNATSWPSDDGSRQQQTLMIKATRKSDGEVIYKKVVVTLYEGTTEGS